MGDTSMEGSSSFAIEPAAYLDLTDDCHHYKGKHQVPWDIQKYVAFDAFIPSALNGVRRYYSQRYSIFSLYDEGVYMTDDAWFGVTPEPVAK